MTEGRKADENKPRFDLLNWAALWEIAEVMDYGAKKYGDRNYEKGMRWGRISAAAFRHLASWSIGEAFDEESGYRHLAHLGACALMLMGVDPVFRELDDRTLTMRYRTPRSTNRTADL